MSWDPKPEKKCLVLLLFLSTIMKTNQTNKLENNKVHTQGDQDGSVNEVACHTEPTHKKVDGWNQPHEVDL